MPARFVRVAEQDRSPVDIDGVRRGAMEGDTHLVAGMAHFECLRQSAHLHRSYGTLYGSEAKSAKAAHEAFDGVVRPVDRHSETLAGNICNSGTGDDIRPAGGPKPALGSEGVLGPISVAYKSDPVRGAVWEEVFRSELPQASFRTWPEIGSGEGVEYLIAWVPPSDLESALPNLKVLFSIGAGIDQLNLDAIPPHVTIVRMLDADLTQAMVEYATLGVLALHRDIPHYVSDQQAGLWNYRPLQRAADRRVGIMGLGVLGRAVAESLRSFSFPLRGWSASPKTIEGVETFSGPEQFGEFLSGCNILVNLLPLTDATRGILCRATFEQLPKGARLLNAARGHHVIEDDLIAALTSGRIDCAVLDVLQEEPPVADHPLLRHPRVMVTPHIASATLPRAAAQRVCDLIGQHRSGLPMEGVVDRQRGY